MQEMRGKRCKGEAWEKDNISSWPVGGKIAIINPSEGNREDEGCSYGITAA
jgi:hypothetical protein